MVGRVPGWALVEPGATAAVRSQKMKSNIMKLTSTVLLLICLSVSLPTPAAELITYTLARGSSITYAQVGNQPPVTEPLTGSFDWTRCPDDGTDLCFDALRFDLESPSFITQVAPLRNDLATAVIRGTNVTCFGEKVDVLFKASGEMLTTAWIYTGNACGTYEGLPERPTRLFYTDLVFEGVGMMNLVAFAGPDSDGDGVPDSADACPGTAPHAAVDGAGCSIEQLVPCAGPRSGGRWKNHGQYVVALMKTAKAFQKQGLITKDQLRSITRAAVHSRCGKKK